MEAPDTVQREACEDDCKIQGGQLASVHSTEENSFIYSLISRNTYIGLTRVAGTFEWTDETALDFSAWSQGEPNGSGDCVITGGGTRELWYDACCDCGNHLDCMCKI